jgi:hypothetical protein
MEDFTMIKIMLKKNELSKDEKDFFEKMNPGFSVTGDVLCLYSDDGSGEKYVVFKGPYTKTYSCRECKEYYELAYVDGYVRFDKETFDLI